jgi:hypothetical protein
MASAALLPDAEADVRALGKASQRQPDAGHRRCQRAVEPLLQGRPAPLRPGRSVADSARPRHVGQRTSSGSRHPVPGEAVAGAHIVAAWRRHLALGAGQLGATPRPVRSDAAQRIPAIPPGADAPRSLVAARLRSWLAGSWSAAGSPPRSWVAESAARKP